MKTNAQVALESAALVCQRVGVPNSHISGDARPEYVTQVADRFLTWLEANS
jgi:hypothetical protein